jgi:phage shock protein A
MSILDRLNLLIRSELNEISRPDRFRSAMSEMESSLRDAKRQQIELKKGEHQLIEQIRSGRQRAEMWEHRAVLALKAGEEDLAREALVQKNKVLAEVEKLRDQLDDQRAYLKDISRALEALEMKLQGTRGKLDMERPSTVQRGAPANESEWDRELQRRLRSKTNEPVVPPLVEETADLANPATFSEFDRMAGKIQSLEANIDAMRELSVDDIIDPRRRELEDIFTKLETTKRTDDDLSDLKARFKD